MTKVILFTTSRVIRVVFQDTYCFLFTRSDVEPILEAHSAGLGKEKRPKPPDGLLLRNEAGNIYETLMMLSKSPYLTSSFGPSGHEIGGGTDHLVSGDGLEVFQTRNRGALEPADFGCHAVKGICG